MKFSMMMDEVTNMANGNNPYWDDSDELLSGDGFALHAGTVLKNVLNERGISVSALAKHIGVARPGFNDMLNAKRALTAPLASKIEDAIGYPATTLMTLMANHELAIARAVPANHVAAFEFA